MRVDETFASKASKLGVKEEEGNENHTPTVSPPLSMYAFIN